MSEMKQMVSTRRPRRHSPVTGELLEVYDRLFDAHGPRNWWPSVYGGKFEMICGAILTQNTTWKNVEKALVRMRDDGYWSWEALHGADTAGLAESIRPSGYYNTKSRKLKEFARVVMVEHDGELERLLDMEIGPLRERLLGIWEETADDIILYAAGKPSFVIDKYTMRIVDRLGWRVNGAAYGDYKNLFTRLLPDNAPLFNEYHALLDGHAARICKTKPKCQECCLADLCVFAGTNQRGVTKNGAGTTR